MWVTEIWSKMPQIQTTLAIRNRSDLVFNPGAPCVSSKPFAAHGKKKKNLWHFFVLQSSNATDSDVGVTLLLVIKFLPVCLHRLPSFACSIVRTSYDTTWSSHIPPLYWYRSNFRSTSASRYLTKKLDIRWKPLTAFSEAKIDPTTGKKGLITDEAYYYY